MTSFPSRIFFLFLWSAVFFFLTMHLSPAYAGSESERLMITQAYKAGQIDRKTYVARKLESYFSKDASMAQSITTVPSGTESREITLLLKEAALNLDRYDTDSREVIRKLLERPTDNDYADLLEGFYLPDPVVYEPSAEEYPYIGGKFKIWYTTSTTPQGGGPHNATLAFVTAVADTLEQVYRTEISELGYPAPPDDGEQTDNGDDEKYDVYLMNCGQYGIYGYTATAGTAGDSDDTGANDYCSFMVIDNDFEEFATSGITPEASMQVTLAHEYHHAIQMGINANVSGWYMEATSTWMEDQVFDDVDDNRQYLEDFFEYPETSLDDETSSYHLYGAWIWNEYLKTDWNQAIIQSIWDRFDPAGSDNALDAISDELVSRGAPLSSAFTEFVTVNYSKTDFYEDADDSSYLGVPAKSTYTLGTGDTGEASGSVTVDHLASNYIKFIPDVSGDATLTLSVDGEDGESVNAVAVQKTTDGAFVEYPFSLDDTTKDGSVSVPDFSTTDTEEVMLVLLNYSRSEDYLSIGYNAGLDIESSSSGGGGCFIGSVFGN